jgi:hypothetical protein
MAGLILGDNIKQRDEFDPLSSVRNSIQPSILAGISVTSAAMLAIESGSGLIGAWQRLGSEFSADTDPYLASLRFDYLDIVYGITTGLITAMLYAKFDLEKALSETALSEKALSEKALSEKALSEKVKSDNSKMITEQPAANRPLGISEDLVAQSIPEAKSLGLN